MEGLGVALDHLRFEVTDLAAASAALDALGFTVATAGGDHWRAAVMPFEHLAFEAGGQARLAAIGVTSAAAGAAANDVSAPTREVEGSPRLAFAERSLDVEGLPLVLSRTLTPEALRPPDALRHPNGAVGIRTLTCVVGDVEAVAGRLEAVLSDSALTRTDRIVAVRMARSVMLLASPTDVELLHPDLPADLEPAAAAPVVVAVGFEVADTARTAEVLTERGGTPRRRPDGSLGVTAAALGLSLEFRAAA